MNFAQGFGIVAIFLMAVALIDMAENQEVVSFPIVIIILAMMIISYHTITILSNRVEKLKQEIQKLKGGKVKNGKL